MKKSQLHGEIMAKMVGRMVGKHDSANAISRKLASAAEAVLSLEKMAASQSPMETDAAHARRIASSAKKLSDKIGRLEAELALEGEQQRGRLQSAIQEKARLVPSQHAAEIRASLRGMDEKGRLLAVREALRGDDTGAEILAAVADGNLITTGLNDEVRRRFVEDFQKAQAPELFAEQAALDEVLKHAPQVVDLAKQAARDAVSPGYLEQVDAAEKAAQDAAQAFNESVA